MTPLEQRLARRIARQRARLRQFEQVHVSWHSHWRWRALAYRRQLEQLGVKPVEIWTAAYRLPRVKPETEI